jgi:hypothetical protein
MNTKRTNLMNARWLLSALLLVLAESAHAQSIENVKAQMQDKSVLITYDLTGKPDQKFHISLYGSHNNYASPLRLVTGAVGDGLTAGKSKVIEWRVGEELVTYTGQIVFRLKGEIMAGPLTLQSPAANSVVKLGKMKEIKWSGGKQSATTRIDLLQDGRVIRSIHEGTNTGAFAWKVPKDVAKGKYDLRITAGQETAQTIPLEIKSGLPLWMIIAPIAVVGGVAVFFLLPDKETPPASESDLPNAPNLPDGS